MATRYIVRMTSHDEEDGTFIKNDLVPLIDGLSFIGVVDKSHNDFIETEIVLLAEGEEPLHMLGANLGFDSDSIAENFNLEELQA